MKITECVKLLLEKYPETRDDNWLLCLKFLNKYFVWDYEEFILSNMQCTITTTRQNIQRMHPELKWEKWEERQKHNVTIRRKIRQQERPQELKKIYWLPDIRFNWEDVSDDILKRSQKKSWSNLFGLLY